MFKKIQKIILFLVFLYAFIGFIILPFVLKPKLIDAVQAQTNAKIKLQSIYFNPFIFRIKLDAVELLDAEEKKVFFLESIILDIEPHSLLKSAIHVKTLLLKEPKFSLIYSKDKILNLQTILKENKEKVKQEKQNKFDIPRIIVDKIAIIQGGINYEDYSKKTKFDFSLKDINFELKDVDTAKFSKKNATIKFHTTLGDGGFFNIKSKIVSYQPFILKGNIDFEASKLYTEYKYMQDNLNLEVADGKISFNATYFFNMNNLDETKIEIAKASISKLRIKPKHGHKDILNLNSLILSDSTIEPMKKTIHLSKVELNSLKIKAKRDLNKQIDWLSYLKSADTKQPKKQPIKKGTNEKPWNLLVDNIALKKISLSFDDKGVTPRVKTELNELNIYLKHVTLEGKEPINYKMNFKLNDKFICNSLGDIKHNTLDIKSYTKCDGLDIVKFRPYIDEIARKSLKVYNIKLKKATLNFDAKVNIKQNKKDTQIIVKNANIKLEKVAIYKRNTKERLVDFRRFLVKDININTTTKDIKIKKTTLQTLNVYTALNKNGIINMDKLIVAKSSKKKKKTSHRKNKTKQKAYRIRIKEFALKSSKVTFKDKTIKPILKTKIDRINLNTYNIDSKKRSWLRYYLSMRLNSKGYIKSKGKIRHTPLKEVGTLNISKLSLKEFSPYIQKESYLKLNDGYITLKSKILYAKSSLDADLKVHGNLSINEFFLNDSRNNSTLLSFNDMTLKSFDFENSPNRAFVNELAIDGFYLNAIINEKKIINFATLSKTKKVSSKKTISTKDKNKTKFPFKIMKVKISSGSAKFADLSLPIKFKTDIHDLNGAIYSISNEKNEISYIDVKGEIDKYGSTKLQGSVDGSNPKSYTDLKLNFRNLDLNSLSGYSASFAGYKIDDGKLFLDLGYEIVDSKLVGKNSIIVKKIKLGDEIKDENTSSLPLGFAIALLEDSDGIIDIDMPVTGNVDEPNFKYGALVWKTFANLLIKAVASPFRFLGSMMGINGDELEYIEFEKGLVNILPPEREKLDKIIKLMIKRPKINLAITPQYNKEEDGWVLKKQKLTKMIMQKSGAKNAKEHQNTMNIDILEDVYLSLKPKEKLSSIKEQLSKKYTGEILKRYYLNALINKSTKLQKVTTDELTALARKRVSLIKEYLLNNGGLKLQRIKVNEVHPISKDRENWIKTKLEVLVK